MTPILCYKRPAHEASIKYRNASFRYATLFATMHFCDENFNINQEFHAQDFGHRESSNTMESPIVKEILHVLHKYGDVRQQR